MKDKKDKKLQEAYRQADKAIQELFFRKGKSCKKN